MTSSDKKRVFSGVQPTGALHVGNYLGAIRNFVGVQESYDALFSIVDLHAITVWQDPDTLRESVLDVAAAYLAAGIDPAKATMFVQSQVSGHAELAWILNCVARVGWLNRMTQFKEKAGKKRENASVGLYVYPNLMAADILLYKSNLVPVGDDQKQHLELTRDIATAFNSMFGKSFFPLPKPIIQKTAARIMSLRDGKSKMSKSEESDFTRINLNDGDDLISQKIKKAKTDSEPLPDNIKALEERPEARNLVGIYAALTSQSEDKVLSEFSGEGFGKFKPLLAECLINEIAPIRNEMNKILNDKAELDRILLQGAVRAASIAEPILANCKKVIGFVQSVN